MLSFKKCQKITENEQRGKKLFTVEFIKLRQRGYFVMMLLLYSQQETEISDDSMQNQNMIINLQVNYLSNQKD